MTKVFHTLSPPPDWLLRDLAHAEANHRAGGAVLVMDGDELAAIKSDNHSISDVFWNLSRHTPFSLPFLFDVRQVCKSGTMLSDGLRDERAPTPFPGGVMVMRQPSACHAVGLLSPGMTVPDVTGFFLELSCSLSRSRAGIVPNRVVLWHELGHRETLQHLSPDDVKTHKEDDAAADLFAMRQLSREEAGYLLDLRAVAAFLGPIAPREVIHWNVLSLTSAGCDPWEEIATTLELKLRTYGRQPLTNQPRACVDACFSDPVHAYERSVFRSTAPSPCNPFSRLARLRKLEDLLKNPPPFFTFPRTAELAVRTREAARRLLKPEVFCRHTDSWSASSQRGNALKGPL